MDNIIYVIESKRSGGGSYAPEYFYKSLDGAKRGLDELVAEYEECGVTFTTKTSIRIGGSHGRLFYRISEYELED